MSDTRKAMRSVTMTRESAAQVLAGIADGLKKSDVVVDGKDGTIAMTPGSDVKLRVKARGSADGAQKGVVLLKLTWQRTRSLREKPSVAEAAKSAPAIKK